MRIDLDDLRRHYASLPDGALLALNRGELSDAAKPLYDEEVARRKLSPEQEDVQFDSGPEPDWLDDAACACAFSVRSRNSNDAATDAYAALHAAGIPCHLITSEEEPPQADPTPRYTLRLMVPLASTLHAASVLDRDIFNEEQEAEWRANFEALSDDELLALNPDILCAGLLDRIARLKKAFEEEIERRQLAT